VLQSILVDLTTAQFASTPKDGVMLEQARGDWLYVDPMSVSGLFGSLQAGAGGDSDMVHFIPGRCIRKAFNRLRVYANQCSKAASPWATSLPSNYPVAIASVVKIWFGTGPCPFADFAQVTGSTMPIALQTANLALSTAQSEWFSTVSPGMLLDCSLRATQVTVAAETSILSAKLIFNPEGGGAFPYVTPDLQSSFNVSPAAAGTAVIVATFRNVRVPRGYNQAILSVQNTGTAATNNIIFDNGGCIIAK
jgi:hypothetical protein